MNEQRYPLHDQLPSTTSATNQSYKCLRVAAPWSQFCGWQLPGGNVHLYMNAKHISGEKKSVYTKFFSECIICGFMSLKKIVYISFNSGV